MIVTLIVIFYVFSGLLAYMMDFAYYQKEYPTLAKKHYYHDMKCAIVIGLSGYIGLLTEIICLISNTHKFKGFKLW